MKKLLYHLESLIEHCYVGDIADAISLTKSAQAEYDSNINAFISDINKLSNALIALVREVERHENVRLVSSPNSHSGINKALADADRVLKEL